MNGTSVLWNSMVEKEVDVCVDYTGTILVNIMKEQPEGTADDNIIILKLRLKLRLTIIDALGYNNTYTWLWKKM
ncbi:MAG: hypothetical protein ACLTG7_10775 [Romboutsia sp.]